LIFALAALIAAFSIAIVSTIAWNAIVHKDADARANRKQAQAFQDQIADLQSQLSAAGLVAQQGRQDVADKALCIARYDDAVQNALVGFLVVVGDLVVDISTIVPGPDRTKAVETITGNVDHPKGTLAIAEDDLRMAQNDRVQYNSDGQPLPCPINPPDKVPTPVTTVPTTQSSQP